MKHFVFIAAMICSNVAFSASENCANLMRPAAVELIRTKQTLRWAYPVWPKSYLRNLRRAQFQLINQGLDVSNVKTVFYPAGGVDPIAAFLLFPQSTQVVVVDLLNFHSAESFDGNPEVKFSYFQNGSWQNQLFNEYWRDALPRILGSIMLAFPAALDIRVYRKFHEYEDAEMRAKRKPKFGSSGSISFRPGPQLPRKEIIFFNGKLPSHSETFDEAVEQAEWFKYLFAKGFQGMIIKGSFGVLKTRTLNENTDFKTLLVSRLRASRGVIFESQAPNGSSEFFNEHYPVSDDVLIFGPVEAPFSYFRNVRALKYIDVSNVP